MRSIQAIKVRVQIEEVIRQRGVTLHAGNQSGERLVGHCPFHQPDANPSFNVYVETQQYHCFGCGAHGDVINFVEQFDGCSRQEAMQRLSALADVLPSPIRKYVPPFRPQRVTSSDLPPVHTMRRPKEQRELLSFAQQHYQRSLLEHPALLAYMREQRGITREGILLSGMGYADGTLRSQLDEAQRREAQAVGLLNRAQQERLRRRIVIPERDEEGWCHWMVGRCVEQQVTKRVPKYLGLSLSKPLLGYGLACKQSAQGQAPQAILVVEGAIDFVIAAQWQLPIWCVALIGTHASRRQLAALLELQQRARGVPILLGLDADEAGRQATMRLMEQIAERGRRVEELLSLDGAKDIGELGRRADGREVLGTSIQDTLAQLETTERIKA